MPLDDPHRLCSGQTTMWHQSQVPETLGQVLAQAPRMFLQALPRPIVLEQIQTLIPIHHHMPAGVEPILPVSRGAGIVRLPEDPEQPTHLSLLFYYPIFLITFALSTQARRVARCSNCRLAQSWSHGSFNLSSKSKPYASKKKPSSQPTRLEM